MDQTRIDEIGEIARRWIVSARGVDTDAILKAARQMTPAEAVLLYRQIEDTDPLEARVFGRLLMTRETTP